jgi:nitroimidazol reductase NimA-like FMN-containing flavoprotein (pyridoxamine 5'-phosphate oxidase superfamily)
MTGDLTTEEIESLISGNFTARIGCCAAGKVYVVPVTYIYSNGDIISHTNEGLKVRMMRENPEVCIEIDEVEDIFNWRSVVAWGIYQELRGPEAESAFQAIYEKLDEIIQRDISRHPHTREKTLHNRDISIDSTIVYKIKLTHKTGRYERRIYI